MAATTTGNRYDLAGVAAGTPTWVDVAGGSAPAPIATNQARQLTSSPDIGIQNGTNTTQFMLVAFDTTTSLVLLNYTIAASG